MAKSEARTLMLIFFAAIHSLAALAIVFHTHAAVITFIVLYLITGFGITVGYHRLLAHHSFRTSQLLQNMLATAGALSLEGGPLYWVSTHRKHHQFTDCDGDPHDSRLGFWWSHMGWILSSRIDLRIETAVIADLTRQPWLYWLESNYLNLQVILTVSLFVITYMLAGLYAAISLVVWAIPLRIVVVMHCTWLTNSAAHLWGYRNFETGDRSTNNWWVAALTLGEGWHNNHHAYPASARHGLRSHEIDPSWWVIALLGRLKLAWDIKEAKPKFQW